MNWFKKNKGFLIIWVIILILFGISVSPYIYTLYSELNHYHALGITTSITIVTTLCITQIVYDTREM
jgi:low affinity Fe/Cu permease